jgi:hypothetical protein
MAGLSKHFLNIAILCMISIEISLFDCIASSLILELLLLFPGNQINTSAKNQ